MVGSRKSYIILACVVAGVLSASCAAKKTVRYAKRAGTDSIASSLSAVSVRLTFDENFFKTQSIDPSTLTSYKLTIGAQVKEGTFDGTEVFNGDLSPESGVDLQVELSDADGIAVVGKKTGVSLERGENAFRIDELENVKGINSDWDGKDFKGDGTWRVSESEK
ncbi:MAG: hypothetical protein AB7T49_07940 [Oligoflexales bacterium]